MKIIKLKYLLSILVIMTILFSCKTIPNSVVAVTSFEKERYLGKWYEIARKDFKYERDLNNVTAEYSLNKDGSIKVVNKGYNTIKNEWASAIGKAKFVGDENVAMLKVSFFGPFYSGYNVIAIDKDYKYALVAGNDFDLLWILSRETQIPIEIKEKYLKIAEDFGYNTSDLIWVQHGKIDNSK